ncbi:T9SS type A sorting domain-containing protein [Flavivirga spongiicola]|uniref:T9SS type A sorting domain-containing protein n=1 Tax=Flavivirga spongiicola TaxID=421621 RepID=A0ABU7XXC0_9FLAO|nr:T9SS type A sorting domain-containing protein [Flavivirga sp. MEBiC05379]MDO5980438.1 T9SS type A sorting domain-containing protein [Flavivirga sp. MEBiC05379]
MKKNYLLITLFIFQISFINAQIKLVHWFGTNTSTETYPRSGSALSSELTTAAENYNGLNTYADNRNVWNNPSTDATVDPNTSPYLSYELTTNSDVEFDRFVIGGAAAVGGSVQLQLRWSVDSYASSLGDFTPLNSGYQLFSIDLSSASSVSTGTVEFRVYFYNASGNIFNPGYYSYSSPDGTPASYGDTAQAVSIWAKESILGLDSFNKINVELYPNPTSERIKISGLKNTENYNIYNILGLKVKEGNISNKQEINIQNLKRGLYFIQLESGSIIKFMKE